jgi:hypothetical protein
MSYRIEEKIIVTHDTRNQLLAAVEALGGGVLFPPRIVNSVYFDNTILQAFHESKEGVTPRRKIRLRSYPEAPDNKILRELKISSMEGRFKTSIEISRADANSMLSAGYFDNGYGQCLPTIEISYSRHYFLVQGLRLTFDEGIRYRRRNSDIDTICDELGVVEVKAESDRRPDIDNFVPELKRERFSKYERGIELLGLFSL